MKTLNELLKRKVSLLALLMALSPLANAQLKIGDNPTDIQKSSILELESTRQGLLLPRIVDTSAINALVPPDGMIIYLTADKSLRLRSNGMWKKIADLSEASSNWSKTGNSGIDSNLNFIGTVDGNPLIMKTSNNERLRISSNGNIGIGTANPTAALDVNGSVKLENLAAGNGELQVLVLAADGSVLKRTMSASAFVNAIKAINGIQRQALHITAAADAVADSVRINNSDADSTISIILPVQNGSSPTKPYGFLTYADWQKIQSGIQSITIGAVAAISDVNGASITTNGTSSTIILHPADKDNPGIVSTTTQTFAGDKTFNNAVTVNGALQLNSVANNNTADSVLVVNNGKVEKRMVSASAFGNAIRTINSNRDSAQVISFNNTGADLSVSTNGKDSILLHVPDAGVISRGVVTTSSQRFAGTKNFQDSVTAAKAILVGSSGNANSTMQVDGSLSLALKTVSANYNITSSDNTILVNTTSGAIGVTLPAVAGISGRIYTIKKIGTGGIDNALTISSAPATIDGGNSYTIYNDWTFVSLQTDGVNWFVIKK